jgi:transglutaminase-like putative cysteine protease
MNAPRLFSRLFPFAARGARPMSKDKADILLLLGSCALVLLPHAGHLPAWVAPVCAILLAWRGWVTFRGNRMPPRWLLLPLALVAMFGVYRTYGTMFGREPGVSMLTLLLTLKLLEMHAKRDLFVVLFLSFFLILASFFYSQSIGTALMTIAAVIAILTTQLSFQYTGIVPPLRQRLRLGATILALAAPLTLVLFLLFPRIQGPLWGMPGDAQTGRTGLSETMAPGNIARLAQSDDIAFRVKFDDAVPEKSRLYWRGIVLGDYDGRTWMQPQRRFRAPRRIAVNLRGAAIHYQVTLEPHGRRWLFALELPEAIPEIPANPAEASPELQLLASHPVDERLRYDAVSHVEFDLQPNESPRALQQWLELPDGFNPRTLEFAARLRRQSAGNVDLVSAVLRHFRQENFRYTLEPPRLGKHVIDEFLFDTRAGFCEHYAGAFVVLMRAAGIPARVVTGYQGGEINPADGFMTIRQSDAHAWAEVWLEKRGWVRVDPTAAVAPNRVEQNLSSVIPPQLLGGLITLDPANSVWFSQWLRLRQNWDAVSNAWNQWVLNYTPDRQKNFFRSLGFDNVDWRSMAALMLICGIAATAIAVAPLLLRQQKRDPFDALYQRLCLRMARRGLPRSPHEGPRAYALRLTAPHSPLPAQTKTALARFLELYETVRYGAASANAGRAELSKLKSLLAECR